MPSPYLFSAHNGKPKKADFFLNISAYKHTSTWTYSNISTSAYIDSVLDTRLYNRGFIPSCIQLLTTGTVTFGEKLQNPKIGKEL